MSKGKDLGALVGQIGADIREWEKAMDKMKKDLDGVERRGRMASQKISKSLNDAGKKMQRMGRTLTTSLTVPIATMAGLAVRQFGNFDAAMNKSLAIMGDVSAAMETQMANAARDVGRTMSLSAQEAAESYFYLASAGLNAEQAVAALPQVAQFAQAGMFDMALATDLATDAQSALGLTVDDTQQNLNNLTRVTDVLVKANTLANATVEQFSTALTREAGAALKSFNIDMEEGVAVLAAFADQGVKGEIAGTGLSRILRLMTSAAVNNKAAMRELGIQVFDSNGKIRNMADIIANMETALGDMSDAQRVAALESIGFSARVQGVILPLLGSSEAIREYEAELRNAGGTTKEVSDNQMNTFNEQLSLLWDNVKDIGIAFGQTLEPAMQNLVKWARGAAEAVQSMSEESRKQLIKLAVILGAGGPLLLAAGLAFRVLAKFAFLLNLKFLAIGALLASTVVVGQWFVDNWEKIKRGLLNATEAMGIAFMKMGRTIMQSLKAVVNFVLTKVPPIAMAELFGIDVTGWATEMVGIDGAIDDLTGKIEEGKERLEEGIASYNDMDFTTIGEAAKHAFELAKNSVINGLKGIIDSAEIDELIASMNAKFEEAFTFTPTVTPKPEGGEGGGGGGGGGGTPTAGAPDLSGLNVLGDLKAQETALEKLGAMFDTVGDRAHAMANAISQGINQAAGNFLTGVGQMLAGGVNMRGVLDSVLITLAEMAIRVGKIAIAVGIAVEGIKKALQSLNPVAAIAAGAALIALGSWAKSSLQQAAKAREEKQSSSSGSGIPKMASGGVIPPGFPNDSYPALLSSGETVIPAPTPLTAGGGQGYIYNEIHLDGDVVWKNQKKINHKRRR